MSNILVEVGIDLYRKAILTSKIIASYGSIQCQIDHDIHLYNVKIRRMYRKEASLTTENNFKIYYNLFQMNQTVIRLCFYAILLHLFWHK